MALIGGFTEWAHLRLRDHRPGPMSYTVDNHDIPKGSMLGKYAERRQETTVGPGEYHIPTTVGQCRSTVFGPPCDVSAANDVAAAQTARKMVVGVSKGRSTPPPLPKQYSLALSPDTPAFSMYGKIRGKPASATVGPGDYAIPSVFDSTGRKGPHFGQRTKILTTRDNVPGPATYNVPRFGDEKPKRKEFITSVHKVIAEDTSPGPGSYGDPTTIAARCAPPKQRLYDGPSFGGRYHMYKRPIVPGPGPADYGDVSRIMRKGPTHTPVFAQKLQTLPSSKTVRAVADSGPGPGDYPIPSEFDQDFRKGMSFGARTWRDEKGAATGTLGPGAHDLGKPPMTSNGFRFAARPFDPAAMEESAQQARAGGDEPGGPGMYHPNLDAVRPSKYANVSGFGIGSRFPAEQTAGPLCYDVKPTDSVRGTVFYRGDYSRSRHLGANGDGGPSYNVENDTIAEGVRSGKGFTFGLRYPARATHQVCKPYDETTNINCQYEDETTWMTKVKF
ncbi:uncharacterized protein TM35_000421490 [Trypanosoma theileri]|uniref:Sperm-tail PG-rich repeat n=1 Tax=Trypanosoma theileri TaxID=67003 RepID=A0A1X0NJC7_9TRYP|nr:uncharacterized protein TM35_000421490 [Trypanosoma theileri]ORC84691.1 hypothetical protein TM35_000421490 [Trypanosoma theileri]